MAYMKTWPRFVAFHSIEVASEGGGETTICNIDQVSSRLGELLRRFEEKGVTYRRAFRKGVDITWQNAFQTNERDHVEDIARLIGMKLEWRQNDTLITSHTAQGTIESEDGKPIYFNQAHLFHPSALDAQVRTALTKMFGADALPRSASYGDGEPIADEDLIAVRAAFDAYQTKMCWRPGDVLILDNMRFAHGRLPFKGARRLNVALARKVDHPVRSRL
jgi:alpha-ketoglutarate-dependent taurine dioxygenase